MDVENDNIIEIGALKVREGKVTDRFMEFLKPDMPISPYDYRNYRNYE